VLLPGALLRKHRRHPAVTARQRRSASRLCWYAPTFDPSPPRPPSSIIKISLRRPSSLPDSLSYQMASQSSAFLPCMHRGPDPCTGAYFCSQRHSLTACPTSTLCWLCALKCSYRCLLQQSSLPPLALSEPPPTHALRSQVTPHVPLLALNP
jgi:hypothetical protein